MAYTITQGKGKVTVQTPEGPQDFPDAMAALKWVSEQADEAKAKADEAEASLNAIAAEKARKAAEAAKPLQVRISERGQVVISGNDREMWGAYPISLHGYQFDLLVAHFEEIRRLGEQAKADGRLVQRWQDLRPSSKATKNASK